MIKLKNPKISMLVNFDSTTIELFDSKSSKNCQNLILITSVAIDTIIC